MVHAASGATSCVLRPQQTEGPFFVEEELNRADIRTDPRSGAVRPGVPLQLSLRVSRLTGADCGPLEGARIDVWGVGTKLDTCFDQPALGAIYKLSAICDPDAGWRYPVKLSEHSSKISIPGVLGVRRYVDPSGRFRADMIYDESLPEPPDGEVIVDPADALHMRTIAPGWQPVELVEPVMRAGVRARPSPSLADIRARTRSQLGSLHPGIRRLLNPHIYPVGLEMRLHERRRELVLERRRVAPPD
jgi:nicotinate phosphoribosyltransferase